MFAAPLLKNRKNVCAVRTQFEPIFLSGSFAVFWKRPAVVVAVAAAPPRNQPPQPGHPNSVRILFSNCSQHTTHIDRLYASFPIHSYSLAARMPPTIGPSR